MTINDQRWMKRTGTGTVQVASTPTAIAWDTQLDDLSLGDISYSGNQFIVNASGTYRLGGFVTVYSATDQRPQHAVEVYVNGLSTGYYRTSSYIRNSGNSWDYWVGELAGEPMALAAGDTVELRVLQVNQSVWGGSGSVSGLYLHVDKSVAWLERMGVEAGGGDVAELKDGGDTKILATSTGATVTGVMVGDDFALTSDARLKTDLVPLNDPLALLAQISGYRGRFIDSDDTRLFLLAQEVAQTLPEAVSQGEDGNLAVSYMALVPVLIEAIKVLQGRIEALEGKQ